MPVTWAVLPFFPGDVRGSAERGSFPEGPTIEKIRSRSKCSISIEIFNLARKYQSRRLDFPPQKNRAAVGGSLENFILARKKSVSFEISILF